MTKSDEGDNATASGESGLTEESLMHLSHEIRTPLTNIMGMIDMILSAELTDGVRKYATAISNNAKLLEKILMTTLERGRTQREIENEFRLPFTFGAIVERLEVAMKARASAKNLAIETHVAKEISGPRLGDESRIEQILANLLGNALKYTPAGKVRMEISAGSDENQVYILVDDTGPGVPVADREKIFQRFQRGASKADGVGLGLAICRKIVSDLGGRIWVEDAPMGGARFAALIACPEAPENEAAHKTMPKHESVLDALSASGEGEADPHMRHQVLVVDDDEDNLDVVARVLASMDCDVSRAKSGAEAAALYKIVRFHLVLMDVEMPVMDGPTASKEIRRYETEKGLTPTPIVAYTAYGLGEVRDRCLSGGIDGYLQKPLSPRKLKSVVRKWLASNMSVLVLDDDDDTRTVMQHFIRSTGEASGVSVVGTQDEAMKVLGQEKPEIVMTDLSLAGGDDGVAFAKGVRTTRPETVIVAVTGMEKDNLKDIKPFDIFLQKPVDKKSLGEALKEARGIAVRRQNVGMLLEHVEEVTEEVDLAKTRSAVKFDEDLIDLLPKFMLNRAKDLETLRRLHALGFPDLDECKKMGHRIKGVAATYGFPQMAAAGEELERFAKSEDRMMLGVVVEKYAESFAKAKIRVKDIS